MFSVSFLVVSMDRPILLLISFIGLLIMMAIHSYETLFIGSQSEWWLEWLPLYLVWSLVLFYGLFKKIKSLP